MFLTRKLPALLLIVVTGLSAAACGSEEESQPFCGSGPCTTAAPTRDKGDKKGPTGPAESTDDTTAQENAPGVGAPPPAEAPPEAEEDPAPEGKKLAIDDKINFEFDSDEILPESIPILQSVGKVIREHPGLTKLSIEGHTSSEGTAAYNQTLSEQRAAAVRQYLITKEMIDGGRLVSKGWGETKPIADNDTEAGREANRRVEFIILEASTPVPTKLVQ
jgi:outer membrane protein OmpA-like peptidoglycan-associated protein